MTNEFGPISSVKNAEELTRALRGTTMSPNDKLTLAWSVWNSEGNSSSLGVHTIPHKTEFLLEWIVSALMRSIKTKDKGAKPSDM